MLLPGGAPPQVDSPSARPWTRPDRNDETACQPACMALPDARCDRMVDSLTPSAAEIYCLFSSLI